jgi:Zn-dependent protease
MLRSWKLGRAFGIDIYVHWTFLLLLGFVLFTQWDRSGLELALYAVLSIVSLFGCVVLHELGHALTARHFGIPTRDITLYPIGGVARLERMSERPWEEFLIAIAGPAVNVVIAGVLFIVLAFSFAGGREIPPSVPALLRTDFLSTLLWMNLLLVAFNMVPAFPMDGGRVLRALLVGFLGYLRATEVAAQVGKLFALLFVLLGLLPVLGVPLRLGPFALDNPMLLLVGGFLYLAGQQELAMIRRREQRRLAGVLGAGPAEGEILDAVPVLQTQPFTGFIWDSRHGVWVAWQNGRPVQSYRAE